MKENDLPVVSIIIPVKPGGEVKALRAVEKIDYPGEKLEVIVAEGCHPSIQRNEAVRQSKGEILYFLDDDACPTPSNIKRLIMQHRAANVAAVGGPSLAPEGDSFIQKCFESLFISPFGGAGIKNRYQSVGTVRESSEKELILCNLSFKRSVFEQFGGLNEKLFPNEENDLMVRIEKNGCKLIHDPHMKVFRSQRKNIKRFARQILNYGRGRMEQTLFHLPSFGIAHFVPLFFLVYVITLPFIDNFIYWTPLFLYLICDLLFSFLSALKDKGSFFRKTMKHIFMMFLFPVMHLCYGAGMLWGMKTFFLKAKKDLPVYIKKIA
ncbi:MAG: glycosyltransferase [Deltaproteobacteria bacterium]|nr:glycosyltransferase [Deltaproteobacteria bacterium]